MLTDSAPQTLLLNEMATPPFSSLSRRSTFDEDAFFSPVRSKPEPQGTCGLLSSQQTLMLPTVNDNVLKWFYALIFVRRLRASLCVGAVCAVTFSVSLLVLQFSLRSPLRFFSDAFSTFFAASTFISTVGVALVSFVMCLAVLDFITKADQLATLEWTKSETWLGCAAILLYNALYSFLIFTLLGYSLSEKPLFEVAMFSTIISALSSIFRNDFQLNFSGNVTQLGLMHTILGFFSLGRESMLVSAFRDAARIVAITATASSVTGFFSRGLSSLLFLLNISFHIYCVVIITGHLFTIKVLLKMIRHIVMKPIYFPLPPPFLVHTPTPEQTRTLVVAIGCEDALLKLFAFADLRRIAWTDLNRRLEVFSLSQPGGHPRNWSNVSTACFNILERIRDQIESPKDYVAYHLLKARMAQWWEASCDARIVSIPAPQAHQAQHRSGVGKLVPDLSMKIAALARYMGGPPRVVVKARYAFRHLQRCLMKSNASRLPQILTSAESFIIFLTLYHLLDQLFSIIAFYF